jgi:phospholipase/carboxylesterase
MIMRRLARFATLLALVAAPIACAGDPTPPDQALIDALTVHTLPVPPTQEAAKGTTPLGIASPRDGWLYVPSLYVHTDPTPLVVLLHDAGGDAAFWDSFKSFADTYGVVLLAIESRFLPNWDVLQTGNYGVDVDFLEEALEFTFDRVNVDPTRISIAGFVDGGTEALGIGIANAGLFSRVIAYSPALLAVPFARGFPRIFVSAGESDDVVTTQATRENVVVTLRAQGFTVDFQIFAGGHTIPTDIRNMSFELMIDP